MSTLDLMSWIIGIANPLSALLVGAALALLLSSRPRLALWCTSIGWLVLLIAQLTFLGFGFKSGFPGFRFAQPAMILVAAANLWASIRLRRRRVAPSYEYAVRLRGRQGDWTDEATARAQWGAMREDALLLRRPIVTIEVIEQPASAQLAEPSQLG